MPRSSRHRSHKQSKHREQSDSDEDVKTKEDVNVRDEFSVRISRDSGSLEKRKISSGKDGTGHGNGDTIEEYSGSKRKRDKTVSGIVTDRWNGGGIEGQDGIVGEKEIKGDNSRVDADKSSRSKSSADLRSKSSRKHEASNEKREEVDAVASGKEECRAGSKVDLKRNSDKDQGRKEALQYKSVKESKDRDRGSEKKVERKRDEVSKKMDLKEEWQAKRDKENAVQDEFRNLELEKELEKRMRRRTDSSREKHQDDVKESESRKSHSKNDSAKSGRHKDEKHKDGSNGDKHLEDVDRESRYREGKLLEDSEDRRNKGVKHREDGKREHRYKDSKYHDDVDRDIRHRDDKNREDSRYEENNLREDSYRGKRKREDKYLEDDGVDHSRYRDDKHKHHETSNGESKNRDDKIHDGREDDRRRDDKYHEDSDKDNIHRDRKQREDNDRSKRLRDIKYKDDHSRDGSNDKHDAKRVKTESGAFERHKKSTNQDSYDHTSRDKDGKERRRDTDKDYNDSRSFNTKDQTSEIDKKYAGGHRMDTTSDQGKSSSRNADMEISSIHSQRRTSPNSGAPAKNHSRIIQEDVQEKRSRGRLSSKKEVENASSITRSIERSIHKDDIHYRELSVEKHPKLDARSSPLQLADKSPSSARHFSRSDGRRSYDIDDSGQRSGGGLKDGPGKESSRGSRDQTMEAFPGNDDTFSASPHFTRSNHTSGDSKSNQPAPPFRTGSDSRSMIGSMEDESRGKSNNHRNWRVGDSNMGSRAQGNSWKGIQSWPSPAANGFMPFQHGPAFHPMMQQFHAPPIFGVRPPMELNHSGIPYHMHDSVHGRPLGWHNPMADSTPLGWDVNSAAVYRDESHMFGRLGWDQNRAIVGMQSWETHQDTWKGQQSGSNPELDRGGDGIINGNLDDASVAQSAVQSENDLNLENIKMDDTDVTQSTSVVKDETIITPETISEEIQKQSEISKKDDASHASVYLSKIGVSVDLTAPDFYDSCMNFKDIEDEHNSDKDDSVILYLERARQNRRRKWGKTSKGLPQPTTSEALFLKALCLYHKHTEGWMTVAFEEDAHVSDMAAHEDDKSAAEKQHPQPLPMEDKGNMGNSPSSSPSTDLHQKVVPDYVMLDTEEAAADLDKAVVAMDFDQVLAEDDKLVETGKEDASNVEEEEDTRKGNDDPDSLILSDYDVAHLPSKEAVLMPPGSDNDGPDLVNLTQILNHHHPSSPESTH